MKAIVCINNRYYIGKNGEMMWRCKDDFIHFKKLTMGGILIVGATTFEKDLKGKQLPGRTTFVVGKNHLSLWAAVSEAVELSSCTDGPEKKTIWVIGGTSIYKQLLPLCTEIHMSVMDDDQIGDKKFIPLMDYRGTVIKYPFKPDPLVALPL